MKYLSMLLLCLICFIADGQSNTQDFEISKFTAFDSNELKFDQIVTDSAYVYWKCMSAVPLGVKNSKPVVGEHMVTEKGNEKYARFTRGKQSTHGFLMNPGPVFSYYYIVAVRNDKTVEVINTDSLFAQFIGHIDNLEEAKLIARRHGLYINLKRKDTGAHQKVGNDYLLYCYDHLQTCFPDDGSDAQSVKSVLKADGEFKILSRYYYNK